MRMQVALVAHADSEGSVQAVAESLLAHAQKRRSKDDISIIVVKIAPASQLQRVSSTAMR